MITPRPPLATQANRKAEMLACAMLAFGLSLWMGGFITSDQLLFSEEGNALFQAQNFLDGTHSRNPYGLAELVDYPSMTIVGDQDWKSRFAPGHSFWLIPGVWIGWPRLMTALSAGITMMALYGIGWRLRLPRLLLPVLVLLSPFFLFLHATLLPQTSGVMLATLMLGSAMKWRQERQTIWGFISGFYWSLLFQVRPLTAVFLLIPFAVDVLLETKRNRKTLAAWAGLGLFLLAMAFGVWAFLRYNQVSTRNPLRITYLEHEPSEHWGFGLRRTQGGDVDAVNHTLHRGALHVWSQLRSLDRWMLGGVPGTLLIWLGLLAHGWNRRWSGILAGCVACTLLGYWAFWDPGPLVPGPLQLAELFPFLLISLALGLSRVWRRMSRHPARRLALFGLLGGLVMSRSIPFAVAEVQNLREAYGDDWKIAALVDSLPGSSLVFLPEDLDSDSVLFANLALNRRGLDSPVLRLQAKPVDYPALADAFPDRAAYVLKLEPPFSLNPVDDGWEPVSRVAANSFHSRHTGINQDQWRVAVEGRDQPGYLFYGWYLFLPPGDYECRFDLRWSGVREDRPLRIEVMTDLGRTQLVERVIEAGLEETVLRFRIHHPRQVEARVFYGGSGEVELRRVEFQKAPEQP